MVILGTEIAPGSLGVVLTATALVPDNRSSHLVRRVWGGSGPDGKIGDGKIFILPLDDCIRIRTGERGPEAI
jgi:nitrogen regulatory protein PII